jgi:phosphatidylglycerol:prolipoprotein diacylglycerol transferase
MYPILLSIPLPNWSVPLMPALLAVAGVGAVVALFGWRAKAIDLLTIGVCILLGGVAGALAFREQVYTLTELPLSSYGVTLCLALVIAWYLTLGLAKRDGLPRDLTGNCFVVATVTGFVGARLLYAVSNLDEFAAVAEVINVRRGGLAVYGGLLLGSLAAYLFLRARRAPFLPWADAAAPAVALGVALGRVGGYMLGSGFGVPLGGWAPSWLARLGTYPRWPDDTLAGAGAPAWVKHVADGLVPLDSAASLPVHPTQLYEALLALALLGALFLLRRRQTFRGQVFFALVFGYACVRLPVGMFRGDPQRGLFGPHVAEHLLVPLSALIVAASYVIGPSRSITGARTRRGTQLGFAAAAVALFIVLRPRSYALPTAIQLSVAQWLALATAVSAAVGWGLLAKAAIANPAGAMEIHLPEPAEGSTAGRRSSTRPKPAAVDDGPDDEPES